mgnify:CR=1 FL=1|jgi:hypothetical protein
MNDDRELILELLGSLDRIAEALEDIREKLANDKWSDGDDT